LQPSRENTSPCIVAVCSGPCTGKPSWSEEVIASYPRHCTITEATLVRYRHIVKPKYRLEEIEGEKYCVVEHPVKAVFPKDACKLLDKILSKQLVSAALLGPPGTGKSTFLDLVEKAAPANVVRLNPEEIINKYVGETEKAFKRLLDECESAEPCLLLVDEADQLIEKRGEGGGEEGYGKVMDNLKRMLLRRLQYWYNRKKRIAILATSNYDISRIDTALLRAGRFGEPVYFPIPDAKSIKLLFRLYGKQVDEEKVVELIRVGASFSNIVEYIRTGELKRFQPAPFAVLEYAPRKELRLRFSRNARIVVNEEYPLSVRIAAAISSSVFDKPVLVLKDLSKIQELYFLGKSMNMPVAFTRPRLYDGVKELFYNYDNPVFFLGKDWDDLPYIRVNLETLAKEIGDDDAYEVICGKKPPQVFKSLRQAIMECLSGFEPGY
jgi:hypothetical protein